METEKKDKKEIILDAAEMLFSEMGYDGTSTRIIAAKASVNMAMLNYYFGSKDGLYKSVLARRMEIYNRPLNDLNNPDMPSWDKLHQWLDIYAEGILSDSSFHKLVHRELSLQQRSDITDFITDSLLRSANELRHIIDEGIKNGTFRGIDIELTIASIFGTEYYLVNSAHLASRFFNKNLQSRQVMTEEIKPRIITHLRDLLNAHLKAD